MIWGSTQRKDRLEKLKGQLYASLDIMEGRVRQAAERWVEEKLLNPLALLICQMV